MSTAKLRTIALDNATHRRLRLHVHAMREDGDAAEQLMRAGSAAVNAWIDAREGGEAATDDEAELHRRWQR